MSVLGGSSGDRFCSALREEGGQVKMLKNQVFDSNAN